ncbi:DUF2613 family protein [Mycobacterium sp. 663a-19]|uniref:DUF2613 family protein n=1 Tax=Mycobacterium sp. 663a-19 TaxID=2986148 RepID=UPI002D1E81D9|nr:DUF2613 family protein [Mycobacterium sp. 663a-19]MEB3980493.1 DUF2613 family protein [Mycobacterium sp. 663a-19]
MTGFALAAAASIAAGLSIGAVATVGVTLAVQDHRAAPAPVVSTPLRPYPVQYGDRCWHGHCLRWP